MFRLKDNEQMAKVLQEEREFYWSQAQTLQQSLTQLSVDKRQTEAELQVPAPLHICKHAARLQFCRFKHPKSSIKSLMS